jgi:hypothetical protein
MLRQKICARAASVALLGLLFGFTGAPLALAAQSPVTVQAFGSSAFVANPTWTVTDFHFFTAPIGDPGNGFADFATTNQTVFPPPGYGYDPAHNGVVPGTAPITGPYDQQVANGLANAGIPTTSVFTVSQFSIPNAVFLDWVMVPTANAPTGASPDFANGPIIPNSIMQITFGGVTYRNGVTFDPNWSGVTDPTTALGIPNPGAGWSHIPVITAEAFDFGNSVDPLGSYLEDFTLTDANGNGWEIQAPFQVVASLPNGGGSTPLPLAALAAPLGMAVAAVARRRVGRAG